MSEELTPAELVPTDEDLMKSRRAQMAHYKQMTGGGELAQVGGMMQSAIDKGMDAEAITALTNTYVKMADRQARQQFNEAFKLFRAECPQPRKTKKVNVNRSAGGFSHSFMFAPLDELERVAGPHLEAHGFSYWWDNPSVEGSLVSVVCWLEHEAGHKRPSHFSVPMTTKAGMSDQQKHHSAYSFGQRVTFEAACGLTPTDADLGGAPLSRIDEQQAAFLEELMVEAKANKERMLKLAGVNKIEELMQEQYGEIVKALEAKKRAQG